MSARVLVVDDILPNVKLLEAKLSSQYYDVLTATSGGEALEKVKKESPDIVLLDIMMPGMDGFEVCKKIKEDPELSHIPVVMVTALTDAADRVRGLEVGADDFLSKPVNDIALMARVRSLVRLKMTVDEWRVREHSASQLGVVDKAMNVMEEPAEHAKILVVEDQEHEARKFDTALEEDEDDVVIVSDGGSALQKITESNDEFDLLIISLNLEEEDGLRLCSHLRSSEKTRSLPIIMIATDDDMERIAHGLEIGAHDYILRPIEKNELLARVRTQIRRKRFQERLRANYEISLSMALTDSLTGLYNRRYLEVHLEKLLLKNQKSNKALGLLLLDIDHFKQINDTHGHNIGDDVLKTFSKRLRDGLRSFDFVARYGGEEFVILLPDVNDRTAVMVAERLRRAIADKPVRCNIEEGELNITTSIGGAVINQESDSDKVLKRADIALYEAKEAGRNCTVFDRIGKINPEDYAQKSRKFVK